MKKNIIVLFAIFLFVQYSFAQQYKSYDGHKYGGVNGLYPKNTIRSLNIFINIIYDQPQGTKDVGSSVKITDAGSAEWPYATTQGVANNTAPNYYLDLLDADYTGKQNVRG